MNMIHRLTAVTNRRHFQFGGGLLIDAMVEVRSNTQGQIAAVSAGHVCASVTNRLKNGRYTAISMGTGVPKTAGWDQRLISRAGPRFEI